MLRKLQSKLVLLLLLIFVPLIQASILSYPTTIERHVVASTASTTNHDVSVFNLTGCPSTVFSISATIGSQGPFRLMIDTGSSTLAVASTLCQNCIISPLYNVSLDGTRGSQVSSIYGDNSGWVGYVYTDDVLLLGADSSLSTSMAFVSMSESQNNFFHIGGCQMSTAQANLYQGIMGMAYDDVSAGGGTSSFLSSLMAAHSDVLMDEFTIQVCESNLNWYGNIWIGGYDARFIQSPFTYTPLLAQSWYSIAISQLSLSNTTSTTIDTSKLLTIIDTGATNMLFAQSVFTQLISTIYDNLAFQNAFGTRRTFFTSGYCQVTNNGASIDQLNSQLPLLEFSFYDATDGNVIRLLPVSSYLVAYYYYGSTIYCPGLQTWTDSGGVDNPDIILGLAFLNQLTTHFNRKNNEIGFSLTNRCGQHFENQDLAHFEVDSWSTCTQPPLCQNQPLSFARESQHSTSIRCVLNNTNVDDNICINNGQPTSYTRKCPLTDCKQVLISSATIAGIIMACIVIITIVIYWCYRYATKNRIISSNATIGIGQCHRQQAWDVNPRV